MIHYIMKNTRYKYILVVGVLILTYLTLIKMEGLQNTDILRVIFGGIPLSRPIELLAFVMCMSLVQFINADSILLVVKRDMYLIIRCRKKGSLLVRLLISIITSDLIIVILAAVSFEFVMLLTQGDFTAVNHGVIVGIVGRGWLTCIFISLLQLISLMKINEMHSFLVMFGLSVIMGFLSYLELGIFSLFPVELTDWKLVINVSICIFYIVGTIVITYLLYRKREVSAYDY